MKSTENVFVALKNDAQVWNQIRKSAIRVAQSQLRGDLSFWVEDIVQEVMIKVCLNFDKYQVDRAAVCTWVNRITANACIDFTRKKSVKNTIRMGILDFRADEADEKEYLIREEMFESIEYAMAQLNQADHEILRLKYYEGKSGREIAEGLSIPENQIPMNVQRARKRLQKEIFGRMAA